MSLPNVNECVEVKAMVNLADLACTREQLDKIMPYVKDQIIYLIAEKLWQERVK